jgi:two-component system, cell cycle sensor histidine kinase and response regulator CckA
MPAPDAAAYPLATVMADSSQDIILLVRLDGRIQEANAAAVAAYGYSRDELLRLTISDLRSTETNGMISSQMAAANEQGVLFETGHRRKDGTTFPVEVSSRGISIGDTRVLVSVVRDISVRKRNELALKASEERYRLLFDASPDGIVLIGSDGLIQSANRAQSRMYRYDSPDELVGLSPTLLIAPASRDLATEILRRRLSGEEIPSVEYRLLRKDGTEFYGETTATILREADGAISGYICITRETTQRKQAEETLKKSDARFHSYFDMPMHGIAITSPDKEWIEVNNQLCSILGYTREEIVRMTWTEITHPDDLAADLEQFNRVLSGQIEQYKMDKRFIRKDGSVVWTKISVGCVRKSDGGVDYIVGVMDNITERKRAEEEKAKLETRLHQAQKMESVGRLAGGVAHDFNNMLAVILGNVEMALEQGDPAQPIHNHLTEIHNAAKRSADLTRQLLAFARKQTITPKVLDLNETVAGMLIMLERLITEDIHLDWQPGVDLWPVRLDPSQIDQILANLCVNARDAIADIGRITIETGNSTLNWDFCAAHAGSVPGEYVRLAVSDNGGGMDKETLSHIFEPFFTTKGVGKGTGLGLATVYGAVKQNGGFIDVCSEPGQGTTFTIYLPRHVGKAGLARTESATGPAVRGRETILLVEDDPTILKMTAMILQRQGYTVLAASSPGEAIDLAREYAGEIQLLMTDVVMPEMNGRDLARNLLSLYPQLKRLFMSGYTADVIAHHGVLDEGIYFIQKPFTKLSLAAKVREVLEIE